MKKFKDVQRLKPVEEKKVRQMVDPKKDVMVVKNGKILVIDKSKEKEYLKKGWGLAEQELGEALGNDNPSHREKPKMDNDGTVHNIPGKKGGLSAYSIKPRLDGKTLKFGTVDNEGNIKVMTVQELAKVLK